MTGGRDSASIVGKGSETRTRALMAMSCDARRFLFSTSLPFAIADARAICQSLIAPPMDHTLKQKPAILLEDAHVTLPSRAGPVAILRGIEFRVAVGDAIAVVGPSGSG